MDNFVNHLAAGSIADVEAEATFAHLPEALVLQEAIFTAARAYYDYLARHGVFRDSGRVRAATLHVDCDTCGTTIYLTDRIDQRFLAVSTWKAFVSAPHGRSRKFWRRGTRGPVHARQRLITQFRLAAAKVKR